MAHVSKAITAIVYRLYNNGDFDKAALAKLRTANSILSRDATAIWPLIFEKIEDKQDLSQSGEPSYAENAIFTALKAYAIYQQGTDENVFMHSSDYKENISLFKALASLRNNPDFTNSLDRRIGNVLTGPNYQSIENSITHLIKILKAQNRHPKIDFSQLGEDLYRYQFSSESARQVTLKWGQDYYWINKNDNQE